MGHAERTCLIGMRLADAVGLDPARRSSLFYALLLKDAGCSTNAAEGRRRSSAPTTRTSSATASRLDRPAKPAQSLRAPAPHHRARRAAAQRARHLRALVGHGADGSRALTQLRCERGADIARDDRPRRGRRAGDPPPRRALGRPRLPRRACRRGDLPARARSCAWPRRWRSSGSSGGAAAACAVARERRGTWFDPALVDALLSRRARRRLLGLAATTPDVHRAGARRPRRARRRRPPGPHRRGLRAGRRRQVALHRQPLRGRRRDRRGHRRRRWASTRRRGARCAAPGCCTTSASSASPTASSTSPASSTPRSGPRCAATRAVAADPAARARRFADLARLAGTHHERLDGSGYPRGLDRRAARPARAHPAGRRRRRGAERRPPLPRRAARRRGAGDHAAATPASALDADGVAALVAWLPGRGSVLAAAA